MVHKRSVLPRAVSAMLLALTACQDLPTAGAPETTAPGASASLNQGQHAGQVPFYCMQGRAAPSGWQTRRLAVFIPRGELDKAGRTVRYEYRRSFQDGSRFASASCIVPYTEGALRRLDRAFDVRENGGADQYRVRDGMITTQCVQDDVSGCPLEPIFVKPPPVQPVTNPDDVCTRYPGECDDNDGGDGGDDWENDGGSGDGGGDGPLDGDADGDGDTLDDGPLAFAVCVAAGIGVDGWVSMGGAAYAGYKLFDARSDVRARYSEYMSYTASHTWREDYSLTESDLLYRNFLSAKDNEEALWVMLASTGGVAAGKIGAAVIKCAPLLAAPTT
jgi:hypothetical protein